MLSKLKVTHHQLEMLAEVILEITPYLSDNGVSVHWEENNVTVYYTDTKGVMQACNYVDLCKAVSHG